MVAGELATLGGCGVEVLSLKLRKSAGVGPFCNSYGHELCILQKNGGQTAKIGQEAFEGDPHFL